MNIKSAAGLLLASVLMTCAGCAPSPAPVRGAEKYDRAFDAAVGAAKEVGVEVSSADRAAGRISGTKAGAEVSIWLQWQPSGSTKVEFNAPRSTEDPKLSEVWLAAYNRRMGR